MRSADESRSRPGLDVAAPGATADAGYDRGSMDATLQAGREPSAEVDPAEAAAGPFGPPPGLLLRRLIEVVHGKFASTSGAVRSAAGAETWQQAFEAACLPHRLQVRTIFLSPREAVGSASSRTPLVTHRGPAGDEWGWVALLDRAWVRARAASSDGSDAWVGPSALATRLGAESADETLPWLLVEPDLPSADASAPGAKLGHGPPPLRRLLELLRPDRSDLWTVVLYAVLIGGLTLATPIAVQQLVNTVAFGGLIQPVVILALLLFGGLAFSALLSALQAYTAELIQRRVFVRVVMDVAERLPRVEIDAFDRHHGPELVNRLFDVVTVQKVGALLMLDGTAVLLQTGVGLLILSFYHPLMLAFSILLLGAIAFVVFVLGRNAVPTAIQESYAKYAVVGWMEELARHPAAFRSQSGRLFAADRADRLATEYVTARRTHYRIVLRQLSGALGLQVIASSGLLALGGGLVVAGQLTLGQLVASELIITAIVAAVARLGKYFESFYDLLAATDKLGVLFDLPLERESGSTDPRVEGPAAVEVRDVSYRYGSRQAVEHLSLRIEPGERVALVGPVGSGKTTLLDLLAGLREPDSGYIAIDGCDLRDYRLDALRDCVASVREPEIFAGTIIDNLRVARPGLSMAEASQALDQVGLLDDLRGFEDGLYTELATDGLPLARGHVAGLMLARAIVARPRLLILDAAFGNLEDAKRKRALDAVFAEDAPWTVVVVSKRADVLERCGRTIDMGARRAEIAAADEKEEAT